MRKFSIRIPLSVAFLLVLAPVFGVTGAVSADSSVQAPALAALTIAPDFKLEDPDGKIYQLSNLKGRIVVLEWTNPECPFVKRHYTIGTMVALAKKYGDKVTWLAVDSSARHRKSDHKDWMVKNSLPFPVLDDSAGTVGKSYGAKTTPHMFVIDTQGRIAYEGAIDSDSDGSQGDERIDYVDQALAELTAGQEVTVKNTRSYGCSVKYSG